VSKTPLVLFGNGQVSFPQYNAANFVDPAPAYLLGVDAAGNVVQATSSSGPLVYVARITQSGTNAPTAVEIVNTTGATFSWVGGYVGAGIYRVTASSAVLTSNKTAIFVTPSGANPYIMLGSVSNTTQCIVTSSSAFSGYTDNLINGAIVKIEIYP
jgi:hypothetical protein